MYNAVGYNHKPYNASVAPIVYAFDAKRAELIGESMDVRLLIENVARVPRTIKTTIASETITPMNAAEVEFEAGETKWVSDSFEMNGATHEWKYQVGYKNPNADWIGVYDVDPALQNQTYHTGDYIARQAPGVDSFSGPITSKPVFKVAFIIYYGAYQEQSLLDDLEASIAELVAFYAAHTCFDLEHSIIYSDCEPTTEDPSYLYPTDLDSGEFPNCHMIVYLYDHARAGAGAPAYYQFRTSPYLQNFVGLAYSGGSAFDPWDDYSYAFTYYFQHEMWHGIADWVKTYLVGEYGCPASVLDYVVRNQNYQPAGTYEDGPYGNDNDTWWKGSGNYTSAQDPYKYIYHQLTVDSYDYWPALRKALAGTLNLSGILGRKVILGMAGTITPSGAIGIKSKIGLSGTLTPTGSLGRKISVALGGTITGVGTLARKAKISLAGTLGSSGTVLVKRYKSLSGTLTTSGTLGRKISKSLSGTLTSVGTLLHFYRKSISITVTLHSRNITLTIGGE